MRGVHPPCRQTHAPAGGAERGARAACPGVRRAAFSAGARTPADRRRGARDAGWRVRIMQQYRRFSVFSELRTFKHCSYMLHARGKGVL